jgi:glyoxylase-like metal-dependent hydrolase (beta-lactamase superfamily II)
MRVGALEILPVPDGWARLPSGDLLRKVSAGGDAWVGHEQFLAEDGSIELSLGGFLVRTGDRVVVVDAGAGRIDNDTYHGGQFLESLSALGIAVEDVTDVVFTHLHFDHVGWATQQGRVVFPRATYRSPVADRLEPFGDDAPVAPGITVRHAPGHTPGSAVVVVADGADRALLLGDVVHCPVELLEDDWEAIFDVDPALARRTREALARELEGTDVPVAAAHFPGLRFGRLLAGTGRRHWTFAGPGGDGG